MKITPIHQIAHYSFTVEDPPQKRSSPPQALLRMPRKRAWTRQEVSTLTMTHCPTEWHCHWRWRLQLALLWWMCLLHRPGKSTRSTPARCRSCTRATVGNTVTGLLTCPGSYPDRYRRKHDVTCQHTVRQLIYEPKQIQIRIWKSKKTFNI